MSATTSVWTKPKAIKYTQKLSATVSALNLYLGKSRFFNDAGVSAQTFTTVSTDNGYYLLYINGAIQQSGLYTVGAAGTGLTIKGPTGATIYAGQPVTLVVTNFEPSSTTTVTG